MRRSDSRTLSLDHPVARVWGIVSNIKDVLECIPGCERVDVVSDKEARAWILVSVGLMRKRMEFNVRFTDVVDQREVRFEGLGEDAKISGVIRVRERGGGTELEYELRAEALSSFGSMALSLIGERLVEEQVRGFVRNLEEKLRAT